MVHEITGSNRGRVNNFLLVTVLKVFFIFNYSNFSRENFNVTMKINHYDFFLFTGNLQSVLKRQ